MDMSVNMVHREDAIIHQHAKRHPALHSTTPPIAEAANISPGIGLSSIDHDLQCLSWQKRRLTDQWDYYLPDSTTDT
jgi:hypothetical protein